MPKYLSKKDEKVWQKAKASFKKQKGKKPGKKDWPLVMYIYKQMHKKATNIVIQPFEKYVEEGLKLAEEIMGSGYFSGVERIVVQPGETHHYGEVISNDPKTIYISASRIEMEFPEQENRAPTEEQELKEVEKRVNRAFQMASTLVHEMGHIKSGFKGGEGPAEAEEAKFKNLFEQKIKSEEHILDRFRRKADYANQLVVLANELDAAGKYSLADFVDSGLSKTAAEQVDMERIIEGTIGVVGYLVSRVSPDKRATFKNSLLMKIRQISPELAQRRKNPSAGIGAIFSMLKNMLSGLDPSQIQYIIGQIISRAV